MTDYSQILTSQVKRSIRMSCESAKDENNDYVCIDTDGILSAFCETLSTTEYVTFNFYAAETYLLQYADDMFKSL